MFQQTCPEIRFAAAECVASVEYGGSFCHKVIRDCLEVGAPMQDVLCLHENGLVLCMTKDSCSPQSDH